MGQRKKHKPRSSLSLSHCVPVSSLSHIRLYSIPPPLSNLFLTHTCHQPSATTTVAHHHPPPPTTIAQHHCWSPSLLRNGGERKVEEEGEKKKTEAQKLVSRVFTIATCQFLIGSWRLCSLAKIYLFNCCIFERDKKTGLSGIMASYSRVATIYFLFTRFDKRCAGACYYFVNIISVNE